MLLWAIGYQALPANVAPLVLVLVQALVLLASVVAIWRTFGALTGVALLLYYPLWANALLDFHFDHLVVPLLAAFFIASEHRRFGTATIGAQFRARRLIAAIRLLRCWAGLLGFF